MMKYLLYISCLCLFAFTSCSTDDTVNGVVFSQSEADKDEAIIQQYLEENNITDYTKTENGVYVITLANGSGPAPVVGDSLAVHYTGTVLYGKVFDSSYHTTSGDPFTFIHGSTGLIDGWNEGITEMIEGERAQIIIPSQMAYGGAGSGTLIGPYEVLSFEIELLDIIE